MPIVVFDHQLKEFDEWVALFGANPPPDIGNWRMARGIDDPNRVHVVGEMAASEVDAVKAFFETDKMKEILGKADGLSTRPIEITWLEEVKPG